MFRILLTLIFVLGAGCKPDHHDHGESHAEVCTDSVTAAEYGDAEIVAQPGAKVGDLTRCPISSSVFQVSEDSPSTVQKGESYSTCCAGCIAQLEQSFARRR